MVSQIRLFVNIAEAVSTKIDQAVQLAIINGLTVVMHMKHVFTSSTLPEALLVQAALESEGIPCTMRNEYISGIPGFSQQWPEVWILNDKQIEEAQAVIASLES